MFKYEYYFTFIMFNIIPFLNIDICIDRLHMTLNPVIRVQISVEPPHKIIASGLIL